MPTEKFNRCTKCQRLLPDTDICPHCGLLNLRRRPGPVRAALILLVDRVKEIKGYWTESIDNAMLQAELALRPSTTERPPNLILEPKAAFESIHPDNPPLTCLDFLSEARDSADAMLAELTEANKTCSGMASLLLLDMIREASVMCARIRRIISAASSDAGNGKRKLTMVHPATENRGAIMRDEGTGQNVRCCYRCGRPQDEHVDGGACPKEAR